MATACNTCGAEALGMVCEFCGATQKASGTLEEEMAALNALNIVAQRMSVNKNLASSDRLGDFWSNAWIPSHPDALAQAALQAFTAVLGLDSIVISEDKVALQQRAISCTDALEFRAPTHPALSMLRRKAEESENVKKRVKDNLRRYYVSAFLFCAAVIASMFLYEFAKSR